MNLSGFVAKRRRSLLTLLSMLIVAGTVAGFAMPVGLFPNVRFPRIQVAIDAGDRPVDQMEIAVTRPLEQAVRAVPDVKSLRSTTSRGSAEMSINFAWGTDLDLAAQRTEAALTRAAQSLPPGTTFTVRRMDPTVFPVAAYSLTSATASPVELRRFADRTLSPLLSTIDGVARVDALGGAKGEYRVEVDPGKLRAYGLSLSDVSGAVAAANVLSASGRLEDRGKLLLALIDSRVTEPRQIENLVVKASGAAVVRVRDVAKVSTAGAPQWMRVTADGRDAVSVQIYQQPGGNTVQIVRDVAKVMARARAQAPGDLKVSAWYDQSELILHSASGLRDAIIIGVVLAALVLLVFLRDWKVTLAAVVAVPAVLAATTLVLKIFGQSFNIMTLGGMAAAIGLIIDDAIVMIEHIDRRLAETRTHGTNAVNRAAAEFLRPLTGSSAATTVIFLPLAFLTGVTGAFFKALSITMATALLLSFLTAWWLVPVLVDRLSRAGGKVAEVDPNGRITRRYRDALQTSVGRPLFAVGGVVLLVLIGVIGFTRVGSGFMPKIDEGGFILDYIAPPGTSVTETDRLMRQIEAVIRSTPDVATYSRRTGAQLGGGLTESNTGDFFIRLKNSGRRPIETVMDDVRTRVQQQVPGVDVETAQLMEDLIGDLTSTPQPIEVKLYGDDAAVLQDTAPKVEEAIKAVRGVTETKPGIVVAGDALDIKVDPSRAALEGIDVAEAGKQITDMMSGAVGTQVQSGANMADVRVWIPEAARARQDQVGWLTLKAADGHIFPLRRIADITTVSGQAEVTRENLRRMVPVTARVTGRDTGGAAREVVSVMNKPGLLPAGVTYEMGGLYAEQKTAFRDMAIVFAAAVAAIFVLLLFLYESFRIALCILVMPLAAASAVALGLWVTGVELNIMALMGMTMIIGIVTEVAIFYFTEFETLVEEGMDPEQALVDAGVNRLRPIAMTTLAAILALAPLAVVIGNSASMERPLAVAIIAGLIAQGPLVLIAMPALYRFMGGLRRPKEAPTAS